MRKIYISIWPLKDTGGCGDGGFYGLRDDSEQNNEGLRNEMQIEAECNKEIIGTYGQDAKEWGVSQVKYAQLKDDLEREIVLCIGVDVLRDKLGNGKG